MDNGRMSMAFTIRRAGQASMRLNRWSLATFRSDASPFYPGSQSISLNLRPACAPECGFSARRSETNN